MSRREDFFRIIRKQKPEGVNIDIFEPAWYLRGMETLLMDFVLNPEIAQICLDRWKKSDSRLVITAGW